MKKILACLLAVVMMVTVITGCGSQSKPADDGKIKIVATIFPQYDWVRQILGEQIDDAELTLLLDDGLDLHSFQPSAEDMVTISNCELFIYTGGESDSWVEGALKTAVNKDMIVVNLMEVLGDAVKEEELKEGMEADHEHSQDEDEAHEEEHGEEEEEHSHEAELDEHVWLSLKNAQIFSTYLAEQLGELDQDNAASYRNNAEQYNEKLTKLDEEYTDVVGAGKTKTLLFGDRFPFRYLVEDYKIDYYAAFQGCSAETEASFETIVFLSEKMNELQLKNVMVTETSDQSIADTIIQNTKDKDQKVLVMDSMQSVTKEKIESGTTYLSVMENNLKVLKEAVK